MATKKNLFSTYDLDSVFDAYTQSVTDAHQKSLESVNSEILKLNVAISNGLSVLAETKERLGKKEIVRRDTRKSTDMKIGLDNLTEKLATIIVLSEDARKKLEEDLKTATGVLENLKLNLSLLQTVDTSTLTPAKAKSHKAKIKKLEKDITSIESFIKTTKLTIEEDDKKLAEKLTLEEEIKTLSEEIKAVMIDESNDFIRRDSEATKKREEGIKSATAINEEIKANKERLALCQQTKETLEKEEVYTFESFVRFLEENGLSTVHAAEIFKIYQTKKGTVAIAKDAFKMRKMHPKRDYFIKKVVIPTAVTCAGIGAVVGLIASSGMVGGSTVLGFIPVSGTPGLTAMSTSLVGAAVGLASTPIVLKTKAAITKAHYKVWYKGAGKNLEDYETGTQIENLRIAKLIEKIQETKHEILASKGLKKHFLNAINRNRIHHVEAYTKELITLYMSIENDANVDAKIKAEKLKPIYELLKQVEEFVANDVVESKTYALLTCDDPNAEHTHASMIENIDIFANLKMYLDRVASASAETIIKPTTSAKVAVKNLEEKKEQAYQILNGERLITKMLGYERKYAKFSTGANAGKSVTTIVETTADGTATLTLDDGSSVVVKADDVDKTKKIAGVQPLKNKTIITYDDGTTKTILKKPKTSTEVYIARDELVKKLKTDDEFVKTLKATYKKQTITKLIDALTIWLQNDEEVLSLKGSAKKLYTDAIELMKAEQKGLSI